MCVSDSQAPSSCPETNTLSHTHITPSPFKSLTPSPRTNTRHNSGLTHIDLATGAETWILPIEASFTPAVSPDGALVYVLSSKDRALRSVRADDGKVRI